MQFHRWIKISKTFAWQRNGSIGMAKIWKIYLHTQIRPEGGSNIFQIPKGFAVWCKVTFEEPIETRIKISDPIPNLNSSYPFQYSMAHSSQFVPHPSTNRANMPVNSVRDSQTSLYNQYRYAHEFEKRLLLEPRYLDENDAEPQNNAPFSNAQNSRSYVSQSTLNFATGGRWNSHPLHGPLR